MLSLLDSCLCIAYNLYRIDMDYFKDSIRPEQNRLQISWERKTPKLYPTEYHFYFYVLRSREKAGFIPCE